MKRFNQFAFATAFTIAAIMDLTGASAHEIKFGDLVIGHPWVRQSPMAADVAAGFLTITNTGKTDDRLLKVTGELSDNVQLHDMKIEGGVMKMTELTGGIAIPAGAKVELKPKSLHIMFMDVAKQPPEGVVFNGTLTFEKAGTVDIEFEVKAPTTGMN